MSDDDFARSSLKGLTEYVVLQITVSDNTLDVIRYALGTRAYWIENLHVNQDILFPPIVFCAYWILFLWATFVYPMSLRTDRKPIWDVVRTMVVTVAMIWAVSNYFTYELLINVARWTMTGGIGS